MKILILLLASFVSLITHAQPPGTLGYLGIARNAQGAPLAGVTIAIRLSIKDAPAGGTTLYNEVKSVSTNPFGLYNISINDGNGTRTGNFNNIDWATGTKYLQTEIDAANGTVFVDMGTNPIHMTPYAFQAAKASNLNGAENPQDGDLLEYQNGKWRTKPKTERHMVFGVGGNSNNGNGYPIPTTQLNFIGPAAIVTFTRDSPMVTINLTKSLGSTVAGGGVGLSLNLGYRKVGEASVTEFNTNHRCSGLRVGSGTRVPFHMSGTYQTTFHDGDTYEIGIVGLSSQPNSWNDNGFGIGYVELTY